MWSSLYTNSQSNHSSSAVCSSSNENIQERTNDDKDDDANNVEPTRTTAFKDDMGIIIHSVKSNQSESTPLPKEEIQETKIKNDTNEIIHETNHDFDPFIINHNDDDNVDDSPHLFDEISISTKDSLGPTAFIEPIFDLQATKTTTSTQELPCDEIKSIRDSECVQMYPDQIDDKEIDADDKGYLTDIQDEHQVWKNEEIVQMDEKLPPPQQEEVQDQVNVDENESLFSYGSIQRLAKQTILRSRVKEQRQNLTSKISLLNPNKNVLVGSDVNPCDEIDQRAHEVAAGVNQDVFLGLGKLMCNEEEDRMKKDHDEYKEDVHPSAHLHPGSGDNTKKAWNTVFTKSALHVITLMSFLLNAYNYLIPGEDYSPVKEVDDATKQVLMKDAINLFVIHSKLNKVQNEMKQLHIEKDQSGFMYTFKVGVIIFIVLASLAAKMLKNLDLLNGTNTDNTNRCEFEFVSPNTTKKNSLKRELSSLDKENIFPSTLNTLSVQKDGTLKKVKRTMRFSPEVKRFTPPPLKKASSKQRPQQSNSNGTKSPGIFSPRFQKMKSVKEEG